MDGCMFKFEDRCCCTNQTRTRYALAEIVCGQIRQISNEEVVATSSDDFVC